MPDLVEACIRAERLDDAAATLEVFGRYADATGRTGAQAATERYRGVLAADGCDEHFEAALEAFERSGALPWADRARSELAVRGENPGARGPTPVAQLTPQELRIALAVSEGRTNR